MTVIKVFQKPAGDWRLISYDKAGAAIVIDHPTYQAILSAANLVREWLKPNETRLEIVNGGNQ